MNDLVLAVMILGGSIIFSITTLSAIQLNNANWFKREKAKYQYRVRSQKLKQKGLQVKTPTNTSLMEGIKDLLAETGEYEEEEDTNPIARIVEGYVRKHPEVIEQIPQLISGALGSKKEPEQSTTKYIDET